MSRPPSPTLDRMLAGRATPSPGRGKALASAMRKQKAKLLIPYG
jgi:hypothetical protein